MITKPVTGPWCRFNFGGVDQGLGDGVKGGCVPSVLADALIDSLVNEHPVAVTLDDEGEMTSLLEARNGRWFVVRTRSAEQQPKELTVVEDRTTVSVAAELIRDLEGDSNGWSRHWFFGGRLAQEKIAALRAAIHVAQEREADFNRRMELARRPWTDEEIAHRDKLCARRAKEEEMYEHSPGGRRAKHRSESLNWDVRNYVIGWPGNGWVDFHMGDFHFTFSNCGGNSPAGLASAFADRLENKCRLNFHLNGEGPEFWFFETDIVRYGIYLGERGVENKVLDFEDSTLQCLARQFLSDLEHDVYAWCMESYGACSRETIGLMGGLIGRLRNAIRKRWPRHIVARRDADWDRF